MPSFYSFNLLSMDFNFGVLTSLWAVTVVAFAVLMLCAGWSEREHGVVDLATGLCVVVMAILVIAAPLNASAYLAQREVLSDAASALQERIAEDADVKGGIEEQENTYGERWTQPTDWNIGGATRVCNIEAPVPDAILALSDTESMPLAEARALAAELDKIDVKDINFVCEIGTELRPLRNQDN